MYEQIIKKYQHKIEAIRKGATMSYTGGSLDIKLGVSVAVECPARFWLSGIGVRQKETPIFFTEGTLMHGCAEMFHKSGHRGLDQEKCVNAYLDKACTKNETRESIEDYFRAYLNYSNKKEIDFNNADICHDVISSEKHYKTDTIDLRSGEIINESHGLQGRIDLIENIVAVPVHSYDGRIHYVEVGEIVNAFRKVKDGDERLSFEGYNFLIKNVLQQKHITKKNSVSIGGARKRKDQEISALNMAVKLVKTKAVELDSVTSDIKTSTGPLVGWHHLEQVSFYSYLRTIQEAKTRKFVSIINVQKNKEKKINADRSRMTFSLNQGDFNKTANTINRAIEVIKTCDTKRNKSACFHPIYKTRCPYFAICHSEELRKKGFNIKEELSDLTIKEARP